MIERPIPLYGHEVRAIREGRKTQARRVVKWREVDPGLNLGFSGLQAVDQDSRGWVLTSMGGSCWEERCAPTPCPYGVPGDRLWVRETFIHNRAEYEWTVSTSVPYRAEETIYRADVDPACESIGAGWKPSIFMPRHWSRLTLEVKAVRVERLQEISEADAIAEGVERGCLEEPDESPESGVTWDWRPDGFALDNYRSLWDSINAKRGHGWASNPWVWVVEFEKVTGK